MDPRRRHALVACAYQATPRPGLWMAALAAVVAICAAAPLHAVQTDIAGPAGSVSFGTAVTALPNGNIVVTDPDFAVAGATRAGAVYLYSPSGALISSLFGSTADDGIGEGGIVIVGTSNFVVSSPNWNVGASVRAGAATWVDGTSGLSGSVSAANSLVGSQTNDAVAQHVTVLKNGNYVIGSANWKNGSAAQAGAATWGNGNLGVAGAVSASNSLVGTTFNDLVGIAVTALTNGNYVVSSSNWSNGATSSVGAATWCNGTTGRTGMILPSNSLVGSSGNDKVSFYGIVALSNGNYVVASASWKSGSVQSAGAATWGSGNGGIAGPVSIGNSLVGVQGFDRVGSKVVALANGNYVVVSPYWRLNSVGNVGAVTWANGSAPTTGMVSTSNSIVGSANGDLVGGAGVRALSNGNYVVMSPSWANGSTLQSGAATWGNGGGGMSGPVSATNSLVGTQQVDTVGTDVTALSNGNYVVSSPNWANGAVTGAGAATWASGTAAMAGTISSGNSLVGTSAGDRVSGSGVTALTNGNYVVGSSTWKNAGQSAAGAATWGNGSSGIAGSISAANSLVGTAANSGVGAGSVALGTGNYVVASQNWTNGSALNAGAVTWADGSTGLTGTVSSSNSLVGTLANDRVGFIVDAPVGSANYVVVSPFWNNGGVAQVGAVTLANTRQGLVGTIQSANSVIGTRANNGPRFSYFYDVRRQQVVVGQPSGNVVSIFLLDPIFANGFE